MRVFSVFMCVAAFVWLWSCGFLGDSSSAKSVSVSVPAFEKEHFRPIKQSITAKKAYARIPHGRTVFDYNGAKMSESERMYLYKMFVMIDYAVVERVQTQRALSRRLVPKLQNYGEILRNIQLMDADVPEKLRGYHALITESVYLHMQYFDKWRASGQPKYYNSGASQVQSSHRKLLQAYGVLMKSYSGESAHNKKAFFDYLCALDFI